MLQWLTFEQGYQKVLRKYLQTVFASKGNPQENQR
ncbi:MAG: hypothetical protein ACI9FR_002767 [Cryomorphaceae bacterium]|jgi:hypothetical protein